MAASTSHGSTFSIGGSAVSEVTGISLSTSKDTYEVTSLTDTTWKAFISGLAEGECSIDVNYDPSAHTTFLTTLALATSSALIMSFEDDSGTNQEFSFSGFLTGFDPTGSVGDKLTASVSFKITGAATEAAA